MTPTLHWFSIKRADKALVCLPLISLHTFNTNGFLRPLLQWIMTQIITTPLWFSVSKVDIHHSANRQHINLNNKCDRLATVANCVLTHTHHLFKNWLLMGETKKKIYHFFPQIVPPVATRVVSWQLQTYLKHISMLFRFEISFSWNILECVLTVINLTKLFSPTALRWHKKNVKILVIFCKTLLYNFKFSIGQTFSSFIVVFHLA